MDYTQLLNLKKNHPTWRLLTLDSSPLIIGFFYYAFTEPNRRSIPQAELTSLLDDYLFHIRDSYGQDVYPLSSRDYLESWAKGDVAFLRKYYPKGREDAEFDLTSASEKAIEWLKSLQQKQFVGTESRLLTVFQMMRDLVDLTETDPQMRIQTLKAQRDVLDEEISTLQQAQFINVDPTQVKERFYQVEDTANQLLSDFREVEENFRGLDRSVRERIATSNKSKGNLLDDIFGDQDAIGDSDQGKSFRAFWAFLMSPARQQELTDLVEKILTLPPVQSLEPSDFLKHIRFSLLEAGEKVQRTSGALVDQLRRYLDDQVWMENKRIMSLMSDIERLAIDTKKHPPKDKTFTEIDDVRGHIELPMARALFQPSVQSELDNVSLEEGDATFNSDALYQQQYVDIKRLHSNIRKTLQSQPQISLQKLCEIHPLEQGLSEILSYMNIASQNPKAVIDSEQQQVIRWSPKNGQTKQATLPLVVFTR